MPKKTFSKKIKTKAMAMIDRGMSVLEVAKKIETTGHSIRKWMAKAENSNGLKPNKTPQIITTMEKLNIELREENAILLRIIKRTK